MDPLRIAEHLHGHLGWLAAVALLHPAILLRNAKRKAHLSVALAALVVTAVGAIGVAMYTAYRAKLKQSIFQNAPAVGFLFERKEHLAFGAIFLTWAGALVYVAAIRTGDDRALLALRKAAWWAFVAAAVLATATAALGTVVAVYKTF